MKRLLFAVLILILFYGQTSFAETTTIIKRFATNAEVTAQTRKDVGITPSNIPSISISLDPADISDLADTTLADEDYLLFWDYDDNTTLKRVDADEIRNVPASTTLAGEIELATSGEMDTGNATDRANTPDALAGSIFGQKDIGWTIYDSDANSTVTDGKKAYVYPYPDSPALELLSVTCGVKDLNGATGGATTFMVRRVRDGSAVDMLSVGVTISHNEYSAWDGTVDDNNKVLERGDMLYIDIDGITSGHPQKGPSCTLIIGRP